MVENRLRNADNVFESLTTVISRTLLANVFEFRPKFVRLHDGLGSQCSQRLFEDQIDVCLV